MENINYEVRKDSCGTEVIFNGHEYLSLYDWKEGKFYETFGMTAEVFEVVEGWLRENGYEDLRLAQRKGIIR